MADLNLSEARNWAQRLEKESRVWSHAFEVIEAAMAAEQYLKDSVAQRQKITQEIVSEQAELQRVNKLIQDATPAMQKAISEAQSAASAKVAAAQKGAKDAEDSANARMVAAKGNAIKEETAIRARIDGLRAEEAQAKVAAANATKAKEVIKASL